MTKSEAPERIWAYTGDGMGGRMTDSGTWDAGNLDGSPDCHPEWPHAQYLRADLATRERDEAVMDRPDESKHNKPEGGVYIYDWGRVERAIEKARAALEEAGPEARHD